MEDIIKNAESGNVSAMAEYATELYIGTKVPQDYQKAFEYYLKAANSNHNWSKYMVGVMYQYGQGVNEDIEKARHFYLLAAANSVPLAILNLGILAQMGIGQKVDMVLASQYYEKAAALKNANGAFNLAQLHHSGLIAGKADYKKAHDWYMVAQELGHAKASMMLPQIERFLNPKLWAKQQIQDFRNTKVSFWDKLAARR